jgi:hypothetical protein
MSVIFRLARREEPAQQTCCFCGRAVKNDPVELFVFWPGAEDPTAWFAHDACVARETSMRPPPAEDAPETGTA